MNAPGSGKAVGLPSSSPERYVAFRPKTILSLIALLLGVAAVGYVLFVSRRIVAWAFVALFMSLAINPAIEWLHRRHVNRRGVAVGIIFGGVFALLALAAALVVPALVSQVTDFVNAVPGYIKDLTAGRGPLGFLETKYHVVERVQKAVHNGGGGAKISSGAGFLVAAGRTIAETVAATFTIVFLTLFMLLEGPQTVERGYALLPERSRDRWRAIGHDIYATVGGYVTGNLLISLIAGVAYGLVLLVLGVPFPVALGFLVAVLDLIPLAGASIAGLIVVLVALATGTTEGIVMAVFVVVYQLVENHVLQPVIYGRTVQLSPLVVLLAVLIGSQVAGVLGALAAIPVAGALQVVLRDQIAHRRAAPEVSPA